MADISLLKNEIPKAGTDKTEILLNERKEMSVEL